jgi:hypothetical protein
MSSSRKPMYFDTLKKDSLYLLTPKLGAPTGDKTLLSPMYFPRNILEEAISGADVDEKYKEAVKLRGQSIADFQEKASRIGFNNPTVNLSVAKNIKSTRDTVLREAEDEPA